MGSEGLFEKGPLTRFSSGVKMLYGGMQMGILWC